MDLRVYIKNIKNINSCELVLPIEKGIYGLVGANFVVEMLINSALATTIVRLIKVAKK